jgi:hypothetical protein
MELRPHTLTITATKELTLLVHMRQQLAEHEYLDIQLVISRDDMTLAGVQRELLTTAIHRMQSMLGRLSPGS